MARERLQKILAHAGLASRRAAEAMIAAGQVRVNGVVVTELGALADSHRDKIEVDGQRIVLEKPVYYVLHKPRGVVSTLSDPEGRPHLGELLAKLPERVYPIGRLDFHTSGVLLVTNDGELTEALLHPRKDVPKIYVAKLKGHLDVPTLDVLRNGVVLDDGLKTKKADVFVLREEERCTWVQITLYEGKNRQIHRMGDAIRHPVLRLARISFAGVTAEGLRPGQWKEMDARDLEKLKKTYVTPLRRAKDPAGLLEEAAELAGASSRAAADRAAAARGSKGGTKPSAGKGAGGAKGSISKAAVGVSKAGAKAKVSPPHAEGAAPADGRAAAVPPPVVKKSRTPFGVREDARPAFAEPAAPARHAAPAKTAEKKAAKPIGKPNAKPNATPIAKPNGKPLPAMRSAEPTRPVPTSKGRGHAPARRDDGTGRTDVRPRAGGSSTRAAGERGQAKRAVAGSPSGPRRAGFDRDDAPVVGARGRGPKNARPGVERDAGEARRPGGGRSSSGGAGLRDEARPGAGPRGKGDRDSMGRGRGVEPGAARAVRGGSGPSRGTQNARGGRSSPTEGSGRSPRTPGGRRR